MEKAPFFDDIIGPADPGEATWWSTSDNVKIRLGVWNQDAPMGTILLLPGRTEYIEKYAPTATRFGSRGFATLVIDWRGQGLADRLIDDKIIGHVNDFDDYQIDLATMVAAAQEMNLPQPYYLIGHSMGGCIGIRALMNGLDIKAACFTGPMLGVNIVPHWSSNTGSFSSAWYMRPAAWTLSALAHQFGKGGIRAPGTTEKAYVAIKPFANNMLTTDRPTYEWMRDQVLKHPELDLGGPSLSWLIEALRECRDLTKLPSPNVPCLTFLGTNERIVQQGPVFERMKNWTNGHLELVDGGEHEILMETDKIVDRVIDQITEFFSATR